MALGEAEAVHRVTGARVLIVDQNGRPRQSPVWEHHPAIATGDKEPHRATLVNAPGARPYIRSWATADGAQMAVYSSTWRAADHLGRLALSPAELALGAELRAKIGPFVVVEPSVKPEASPNKDWGADRFQAVVDRCLGVTFVQMGPSLAELKAFLRGPRFVRTESFRAACGVLSHASAYLGPEGGLHHAAAAMRVPAAVIFGSFVHPETTGYPFHVNFYVNDQHAPCGRWARCQACFQALERIRPEDVAKHLLALIGGHRAHG